MDQPQPQPNIAINGDEARILMASMMDGSVQAPTNIVISLFTRLNELSVNQPPQLQAESNDQ
jgi:hypothetical protein